MTSRDQNIWFDAKSKGVRSGGFVYALLSDLSLATKLNKIAQNMHLKVHSFDRCLNLMNCVRKEKPVLIIMDWDGREAEGFKVLKELRENVDFNKVPAIGFVSQSKVAVKEEAQRAGCDRVYLKAEFIRSLNDILMRYAL